MCLYPKLIKNRKYVANKKNGGVIPPISDIRVLMVPVGCGNCMECRKQKAREWQVRLLEDVRHNKNGKFITLTLSNESVQELAEVINQGKVKIEGYELDNEIATLATRRFLERWRKKHKKSIRHWLVTELGHNGTENIHMHGILWTDASRDEIAEVWRYGYIYPRNEKEWTTNYVNERTVNYLIKYVHKQDKDHEYYKSKILTSAGIGRGYVEREDSKKNKYVPLKTNELYRTKTGHKIAMPIYWRNKIYTEEEREKLWLERLDKNERWVGGEKVRADDEQAYYGLLEYYRQKSKRLGYGDDSIDWNKKQYENERRILKQKERGIKFIASEPHEHGKPFGQRQVIIGDSLRQISDPTGHLPDTSASSYLAAPSGSIGAIKPNEKFGEEEKR